MQETILKCALIKNLNTKNQTCKENKKKYKYLHNDMACATNAINNKI